MMKETFKLTLLISFALFFSHTTQAQDSNENPNAIELGFRAGNTRGSKFALDAVLPLKNNRIRANLATTETPSLGVTYNFTFQLANRLQGHLGAGMAIDISDYLNPQALIGTGVEYKFDNLPISLGFDWQPGIPFENSSRFNGDAFGITARYRLIK